MQAIEKRLCLLNQKMGKLGKFTQTETKEDSTSKTEVRRPSKYPHQKGIDISDFFELQSIEIALMHKPDQYVLAVEMP